MGDLSRARRDLQSAQMAVDDRRWDQLDERIAKVETALEGLSEAEQAPVRDALKKLRETAEQAVGAEKGKRLAASIDRSIRGGDPQYNGPDTVAMYAARASEMLASEDARFIPPDEARTLRERIAGMLTAVRAREKQRALEAATPRVVELEARLAEQPFQGLDEVAARSLWQELNALLVAARNNWKDLPADDADAQALGGRIEAMATALAAAAAAWEQTGGVAQIVASWKETQAEFADWEAESSGPSWDGFGGRGEGLGELMPKTLRALHAAWSWHHDSAMLTELKEQFKDDATVQATLAEAGQTIDAAGAKLWQAFCRLMEDAENTATPSERRELDKPTRVLHSVDGWFGKCEHLEPARARAQALHDKWQRAVDELDRQGRDLYQELEAKANARWPEILATVPIETGFTPEAAARFRDKTILLQGVRNRARWDFDAKSDLAVWVAEVPVAGQYEPHVASALSDTARRTRTHVDDHIDWDVLCVVEGRGRISERVTKEVRIGDRGERVKVEELVPRDCITVRVVGLRAGPVAVGPR